MGYYFSTELKNITFEEAISKTKEALKEEGFGVLTEIDMKTTLKQKLDVDILNYKILGACNPSMAYQALQAENKIGTMLPCNVIVQEIKEGNIEIAAVDPAASMQAIKNDDLVLIAKKVRAKLEQVIQNLNNV
ncbi:MULTISPECIES: DUF302 domain-containing protein [Maribacter]|uniref:DUF302 domain-containing protein n=1 Tax=Maribacter flavus TaxID=1658664 RepID=A0ABU7IG27_9FLAO|nr:MULTISPECIES: DUF302 domain-containing protein [Maribacter]MDC6405288.1 DUF302 domain-containing protein [Maribacter sp. PR66]MEE1971903.1 DUF302 domain-containing protein [Maribacter flavus]